MLQSVNWSLITGGIGLYAFEMGFEEFEIKKMRFFYGRRPENLILAARFGTIFGTNPTPLRSKVQFFPLTFYEKLSSYIVTI